MGPPVVSTAIVGYWYTGRVSVTVPLTTWLVVKLVGACPLLHPVHQRAEAVEGIGAVSAAGPPM